MADYKVLPGINVQWPWSRLIASGEKLVETRSYPIPAKYLGRPLALIETPGPRGRREASIHKSQIIAIVTFSKSFEYKSRAEWIRDRERHLVSSNDLQYRFVSGKPKWAWEIGSVRAFTVPLPAPAKKGIIFASECRVPRIPS